MLQEIDELKKKTYCPELYVPAGGKADREETVKLVLAHLDDRPRTRAARLCGVSLATFYRIARRHGGEMRHDLATRNPEHEALVRRWFPTMSGKEMEKRFGILKGRAEKIAWELGVRHTPETEERLRRKAIENLERGRETRDVMKGARKRKRTYREEELRVCEGKPQLTRLKLRTLPYRVYKAKHYLKGKYNYFGVEDEPYVLGYDGETKRRKDSEDYYKKKYGLRFEKGY